MGKEERAKIDVLDLVIETLIQHEKRLDEITGELTSIATSLLQFLDKLEERTVSIQRCAT